MVKCSKVAGRLCRNLSINLISEPTARSTFGRIMDMRMAGQAASVYEKDTGLITTMIQVIRCILKSKSEQLTSKQKAISCQCTSTIGSSNTTGS